MSAIDTLAADLREVFGERLRMVAAFGNDAHSCAVVASLTLADLDRCASLEATWRKLGRNVPLLLLEAELARGLDAFPLEFTEIIETRQLVAGEDLFQGMSIPKTDLRRACEVQARGHVMHLREGYVEAGGNRKAVERLVHSSITPFRALVTNAARLGGISPKALVTKLELASFEKSFPEALRAAEKLVEYVDQWSH